MKNKTNKHNSTPSQRIPDIEIVDLETDTLSSDTLTDSNENIEATETSEEEFYSKQKSSSKKGIMRLLNVHTLFFVVLISIIGFIFFRLKNWGVEVDLAEIFKDGQGTYEDTLDEILPLFDENNQPVIIDDVDTIVAFGNAPFADDRDSEDNLANIIAEKTGTTVYNCSVSGSYLASRSPHFDANVAPMDAYGFYWLVTLATGAPITRYYEDALAALGEDAPPEAEEVYDILTTLDFNEVDVVTVMYDATDYLLGHEMYSDENATDIQQFTGNLEAGIELLQSVYPHIRIIVMSPTYAYAIDEDGNYVSSDMYIYNNRDVLSTYSIKEYASTSSRCVSFIDHLYGTITEDNAKDYLIDNLHLNVEGRELVAERFEYFLNYYSKGYAHTEE